MTISHITAQEMDIQTYGVQLKEMDMVNFDNVSFCAECMEEHQFFASTDVLTVRVWVNGFIIGQTSQKGCKYSVLPPHSWAWIFVFAFQFQNCDVFVKRVHFG